MLKIPKFVNELYYENYKIEMIRGSLIHVKMLLYFLVFKLSPCSKCNVFLFG